MLALAVSPVAAQNSYYWNASSGTNSWSSAANWWTTSGGSTNGGPPGSADTAVFNAGAVNGNVTALLSGGGTVGAITFSNTGTTSLASSGGSQTLYVEANSNQITVNPGAAQ